MTVTFGEVLELGIKCLSQAGIPGPERDADLLMQYITGGDRGFIFLHRHDAMDQTRADMYFSFIDRRAEGEPLQYITGSQEFMGLDFQVDPSVLIPRQDTETVVEFALEKAGQMKKCRSILDMCCGSGAIAVSMARSLPGAEVTACDCSEGALETAARNAAANDVASRVSFKKTDMFMVEKNGRTVPLKGRFDMIVSNPPYIPSGVIETLQTEVRDHEPMLALDGGADGLDFYRILARDAGPHLKKGGMLVMEIGHDQGRDVSQLLEETGCYVNIEVHKDLAGHDRIVCCTLSDHKETGRMTGPDENDGQA